MKAIPARYDGLQDSMRPGVPAFALWTIWEPLGERHPKGSTLSIETIRSYGREPVECSEP